MMTADQEQASDATPGFSRGLAILSAAIAVFYATGILGLALLPILARDLPVLLLLLNPSTGVLLVISERVDLVTFLALATTRRIAFHILFFLLGEWYGASAVRWVEQRIGGTQATVEFIEQLFARVRWPVVFFFPGPLPSVLAGSIQMRRVPFLAVDIAGTVGSLLVIRFAADIAADPIGSALRFSDQHAGLLTALCASATIIWLLLRWRRNRATGTKTGFPWPSAKDAAD
jgi:membrane protein DedA with SNARE-associated domain